MSHHQSASSVQSVRRNAATPALAFAATLFLLMAPAFANEQRITIKVPGGTTPVDNWAFGLSIRGNPTAGGSTTTAVPAGTSSAGVAAAAAAAITGEMGINATASGNTVIISQHNQDPGFNFNPLAPGTKMGTAFGGLSGPGGTTGPWGVSRAFRVWAPAPPPLPLPTPSLQPQRLFSIQLPPDQLGLPGIFNGLEINLLDDHEQLLFSQFLEIEDSANQQQLDFALMQAFEQFPTGLGGWMMLPQQEGFFFGNDLNEWMTGGAIEVLLHPGNEQSQMQLVLEGEELSFPRDSYADFNVDDVVDGLDLAIWEDHYGQPDVGFAEGDANFDNNVNGTDFLEIQQQFGPVLPVGLAAQTVPEPNSLLLAAIAGSLALLRRKS